METIEEVIVNTVTYRKFWNKVCVQEAVYDDRMEETSLNMSLWRFANRAD